MPTTTMIAHYKSIGWGDGRRTFRAGEISARSATDLDLYIAMLRREESHEGIRGYCPPDGQESTDQQRKAAAREWRRRYPEPAWEGSKEWPHHADLLARQVLGSPRRTP